MTMKNDRDKDKLNVRHTIRLTDEEAARIKKYCENTGKNRSDLYREALNKFIRGDKGDN